MCAQFVTNHKKMRPSLTSSPGCL